MFKISMYLPLWLVRLGWLFESSSFAVQYGSLPLPCKIIHNFCFSYIFGITVNGGNSKEAMNLKFLSFFIQWFLSCLLNRRWMLVFQWRIEGIFKEGTCSLNSRHSVIESNVEQILRYYSTVEGSYIGRKVGKKVFSYVWFVTFVK